ncbi:hypothetical protein RND81_10G006800 [Saponaria officinalis]|uniref:Uncharacterized protein n=1 Tax=Saponaria officinalis TaxID=3572 RepID=A0AAW1HZ73_SAPOF
MVDSVTDGLAVEPKGKRLKVDLKLGLPLEPCKTTKIKKGGFKRFLSNNGWTNHLVRFKKGCCGEVEDVDFDSLCGKYLLICCFSVPMFSDKMVADDCRAIIETYHHLSRQCHPFEMVVVVKMRSDAAYDQKTAFDHFYSAFSCLAIPFSDVDTRDYICSCFMDLAILVDPRDSFWRKTIPLTIFSTMFLSCRLPFSTPLYLRLLTKITH